MRSYARRLGAIWQGLSELKSVTFAVMARSGAGRGCGNVQPEKPSPNVLRLHERGSWQWNNWEMPYRDTYQWTRRSQSLQLARKRHGTFLVLVNLTPSANGLRAKRPHLCRDDAYTAQLRASSEALLLQWSVDGPEKHALIQRRYA